MISLYSDCRFECDKTGTIDGLCDKVDGYCKCHDGFYGEKCDKGKSNHFMICVSVAAEGSCQWLDNFLTDAFCIRSLTHCQCHCVK